MIGTEDGITPGRVRLQPEAQVNSRRPMLVEVIERQSSCLDQSENIKSQLYQLLADLRGARPETVDDVKQPDKPRPDDGAIGILGRQADNIFFLQSDIQSLISELREYI